MLKIRNFLGTEATLRTEFCRVQESGDQPWRLCFLCCRRDGASAQNPTINGAWSKWPSWTSRNLSRRSRPTSPTPTSSPCHCRGPAPCPRRGTASSHSTRPTLHTPRPSVPPSASSSYSSPSALSPLEPPSSSLIRESCLSLCSVCFARKCGKITNKMTLQNAKSSASSLLVLPRLVLFMSNQFLVSSLRSVWFPRTFRKIKKKIEGKCYLQTNWWVWKQGHQKEENFEY